MAWYGVSSRRSWCCYRFLALISFGVGITVQRAGLTGTLWETLQPSKEISAHINLLIWREPVVLLVVGQSNAANHGSPRGRAGSGSYALSAEGVFRLEDPLSGASGPSGYPWPL